MNMLRVWGGGALEEDVFYNECSRQGLLVWQDFFFACAIYPRSSEFLDLVRDEAEDIVRRLRNHTCLAAWCGDNESDMIEYDRGNDPAKNPINKRLLPEVVCRHDPQQRYYHPSSPSGGPHPRSDWGGDKRNWGPKFPHGNYQHIRQERARFISESGSKALPSLETIENAIPKALRWPILANRTWHLHAGDIDGHVRGDYCDDPQYLQFFAEPKDLADAVEISQFANAWGVKLLVEQCRRRKYECGGILVWKMADSWACYDHGLFDFSMQPRSVYDWLKRTFQNVIASITQPLEDPSKLEAWVTNDELLTLDGELTLRALLIDQHGCVLESRDLQVAKTVVQADTSLRVLTTPVAGLIPESTVLLAEFRDEDGQVRASATYTLAPRAAYLYHVKGEGRCEDPEV